MEERLREDSRVGDESVGDESVGDVVVVIVATVVAIIDWPHRAVF